MPRLSSARRVRIRISGLVQGVLFRESARREAERLGLTGWIRNEPDGSVSAEAQGHPTHVESFVEWCRDGPSLAAVDQVHVTEMAPESGASSFHITH